MKAMSRGAAVAASALLFTYAGTVPALARTGNPSDPITISGTSHSSVTRVATVKVSDLDLLSRADQRKLEYRIEYASEQVCDGSGIVSLDLRVDYQRCLQGARSSGRAEAARLAQARTGAERQLSLR